MLEGDLERRRCRCCAPEVRDDTGHHARRRGATDAMDAVAAMDAMHDIDDTTDDVLKLKSTSGRLLDAIEECMTNGSSTIRPRGNRTMEEVMQLWGKLTWPILVVSALRSRSASDTADTIDAAMLRRAIGFALDAEPDLEEELRISTGLSAAHTAILDALEHPDGTRSLRFERAAVALGASFKRIQEATKLCFGAASLSLCTSLPVLTHFSATSVAPDAEDDLSDLITGAGDSGDSGDSADYVIHAHQFSDSGATVRVAQRDAPSDLVLVALHHKYPATPLSTDFVHYVCHESAVSMTTPSTHAQSNISKGVMFADHELGLACIAGSTLSELGIEFSHDGTRIVFEKGENIDTLLDAFVPPSACDSLDRADHLGIDDWTGGPLPWEAPPDRDSDCEWYV